METIVKMRIYQVRARWSLVWHTTWESGVLAVGCRVTRGFCVKSFSSHEEDTSISQLILQSYTFQASFGNPLRTMIHAWFNFISSTVTLFRTLEAQKITDKREKYVKRELCPWLQCKIWIDKGNENFALICQVALGGVEVGQFWLREVRCVRQQTGGLW